MEDRRARDEALAQAEELHRLRAVSAGQRLGEGLREIFSTVAAAATIAAPIAHSRLLHLIVKTATQVIRARAGSLLLLDPVAQELIFEVSTTADIDELKKVRVPLGEGVAGLVALTGQPMAISDAQTDPRHATELARQIGYLPQSLLAVPLAYDDQVIGVLELLDKQDARCFDTADMEALGLFASQAAIAIEQSRTQRNLAALLQELVRSIGQAPDAAQLADLPRQVAAFAATLNEDPSHGRSIQLAGLVHDIAERGEEEANACGAILRDFANYLHAREAMMR